MKKNTEFYRGYVSSRPINGSAIPQSLQNLKIRDYAKTNKINFKLSITEYKMKGVFLALNSLKKEIKSLSGIILFSIYQLGENKKKRKEILNFLVSKKKIIHFAMEDIVVKNKKDMQQVETIFFIKENSNLK